MTSERPYSPVRSPEEAIEELRGGGGTQFDPQVVAAFVETWYEQGAGLTSSGVGSSE
jgi:HD-GYP domain-containing protein (c-di-GMP phosphodiesterase class II)